MVNLLIISDVLNTHIIWLWPLETFLWPFEKTFLCKKRVFLNILETSKSASEGAWNLKNYQSRIFPTTKSERSIFWPSRFLFSKDMILMQLWKTHIALLWHLESLFSMLKVILYLTKTLFFQRMYVGFTFFVGTKSRDFSDGCPDFHRREKVFCSFPPCNRSSVGLLYDHVCPQKQTAWSYDIWKQFYGSKRLKLVIFEDWYPFGHPEPSAQKNEQLPIFGLLFQLQVLLKTFLCISKAWYGYLKQSSEVEL